MPLDVELLRSSFQAVVEREPELARRFYDRLFAQYPQVQPMFQGRSRNLQEQMLSQALIAVLEHLEDAAWFGENLRALGEKHAEYGVTPEMYGWVGESLIATLREVCGDRWSQELERVWSAAYAAIAETMQEGARLARAS